MIMDISPIKKIHILHNSEFRGAALFLVSSCAQQAYY